MKIEEILKKPLLKEERDEITLSSKQCEELRKKGFQENKKAENLKWGAIAASILTIETFAHGKTSIAANFLNVNFATFLGLSITAYCAYQFFLYSKKSKENHKASDTISEIIKEKYGVVVISDNCIVVRDNETSYFYDLPDMQFYRKMKRPMKKS